MPAMELIEGRFGFTDEDDRLALWHFHRIAGEFLGWFPKSAPEKNIRDAMDEHARTCPHEKEMRRLLEYDDV